MEFETRLAELEVDIFEIEAADAQDARRAFATDWTPRILAIASFVIFGGYIFSVTFYTGQISSETTVSLVLGYMGGIVSAVTSFYFGSSSSDK